MGGIEKLCCVFLRTFIVVGLWRIVKRSFSSILEYFGVGGFDVYIKFKYSRVWALIFIYE